jgi:hypothetical protein
MADRACASGGGSQSPLNPTGQRRDSAGLVSHHARYSSSGYTIRVVLSSNQSRIGTSSQMSVLSVSRLIMCDLDSQPPHGITDKRLFRKDPASDGFYTLSVDALRLP